MKKIEDLLKKLGIENDVIVKLKEDDKDVNIDELEGKVKENYKNMLRNDASFIDPLNVEITGKVKGTLETKMSRMFGISSDELEAMEKNKRVDGILEKMKTLIEEKKSLGNSDDKDKEIEKLNAKLLKYQNEVKKIREEEIPAIEGKYKGEMKASRINSIIDDEIVKHKIIVGKNIASLAIREKIGSVADLDLDESGSVILKQKGKDLKLYVDNKEASVGQLVEKYLTEENLVQKKNATEEKIIKTEKVNENSVTLTPGAEKAAQRNAELKAKIGK